MYNDAIDELARSKSEPTVWGPKELLLLHQAQIKWLRANTVEKHKTEWKNNEECRQTKIAVPVASRKIARNLIRLERNALREVIGILTGHCHCIQASGYKNESASIQSYIPS